MERHTILVSQGDYPIKGIHFAYMALAKLKEKYPDIKLMVTGQNMFDSDSKFGQIKWTGYKRYLYDLSHSLGIVENIQYTGRVDAQGMVELLRKANVSLIPSAIENAPNSIAEAMMVGTPCVASYVGGNMDMLTHQEEGFLYCFNEPNMLAEYIDRIFSSDELAEQLSVHARATAKKRHDPELLVNTLITIYKNIIEGEK